MAGCVLPHGNEAAALLADIAAADGPSRLNAITSEPARSLIGYRGSTAGDAIADLYAPTEQPRGAVVLIPGLTQYGKDDPRLVLFARSLARGRFLVLVPEIANTRLLKVTAADSAIIADAIEELAKRFAPGADASVGLVAISFGAGPALLAAGETPAGHHVRFAVTIGAYYDISAAIAFATTGAYQTPDGSWISVEPNAYGKFVFLRGNADRVRDPQDRTLLIAIADRRLANPASSIADLVGRLGPEGRAIYDLIDNRDPRLVPKLLAQLPGAVQQELRTLDLQGRELPWLRGPVFLVHGKDDTVSPAGESMKLAGALGPRAELYLVEQFAHVDAGIAGLGDNLRLWRVVIRVLEERDRPI
jgi:pimeloyl-ACP methyl ester carboxylesterase